MELGATWPRKLPVSVSVTVEPSDDICLVSYAKIRFHDIIDMRNLKHAVSKILGVDFYRIQLYFRDDVRREEPLPDWSDAFGDVVAFISPMTDPIPHPKYLHSEIKVIVKENSTPSSSALTPCLIIAKSYSASQTSLASQQQRWLLRTHRAMSGPSLKARSEHLSYACTLFIEVA